MAYTDVPLLVEPDDLLAQVYDYLRSRIPEWDPAAGNLDVWLAEAFAQIAAQVAEVAADVPRSIFRTYGAKIAGVPPIDSTAATGTATFTLADAAGHTIPADTQLVATGPGGTTIAFSTLAEAVIAPGDTTADVAVIATQTGLDGSGLSGTLQLVDFLDFVDSVALSGQTTGGQDGEDDDAYLARLAEELTLSTPRVVRAADAAIFAKRTPGIDRALALDGYNPADGTSGNRKMVAVFPVNADGLNVSGTIKTALQADLTAQREPGFIFNVLDPTRTAVDAAFTATAWPGYNVADVQAAAIAALTGYLSPKDWGVSSAEVRDWVVETKVRYLEVAQILQQVEGLRYVDSLTLNGSAADVTLPGAAPMPTAGTINGTVS